MDALAPPRNNVQCAICADRTRGLSGERQPAIIQAGGSAIQ
jgi:hypothetical protein